MLLKIIGAIILIWLAFALIGLVFKVIGTLLVAAVIVTLGAVTYGAIKGRASRRQIRP